MVLSRHRLNVQAALEPIKTEAATASANVTALRDALKALKIKPSVYADKPITVLRALVNAKRIKRALEVVKGDASALSDKSLMKPTYAMREGILEEDNILKQFPDFFWPPNLNGTTGPTEIARCILGACEASLVYGRWESSNACATHIAEIRQTVTLWCVITSTQIPPTQSLSHWCYRLVLWKLRTS